MTRKVVSNTRPTVVFRRTFFCNNHFVTNRRRRIPAVSHIKQKFIKYAQTKCVPASSLISLLHHGRRAGQEEMTEIQVVSGKKI